MRAVSTRNNDPQHACRPFDRERDGFVLAEGAAVLILESLAHARARGAHIYAELAGYGTTSNAYHMTAPDPAAEQSARAIRMALDEAGVVPDDVLYVCAHGSSTSLNEKAETLLLKKVFGDHARRLMISSIKSMIGHALGAAGILQAAACALVVSEGVIPPTINYEFPDPDCDLDIVPNTAREVPVNTAVSVSAGFSGKNSILVYKQLGALC
jgi:3-oxoacyl-[acyl-carrier-protein] synthase II